MTTPVRPRFKPTLAEQNRQNQRALDDWRRLYAPDAGRIDIGAKPKQQRAAPGSTGNVLERDVLNAVRAYLRMHPLVAWVERVNRGGVLNESDRYVSFNTIVGCSDLIGQMKPVKPNGPGAFLAVEVKAPGKKPTSDQMQFLHRVQSNGGCAGWCDSVEDAEEMLREWAGR